MTAAWVAWGFAVALAAGGPADGRPVAGGAAASAPPPGDHRVTVYVRGLPAGHEVEARRGDERPLHLIDAGTGVLEGDLYGPPARFLTLQLVGLSPGGTRTPLYDGLVVLADPVHDVLAFQYQDQGLLRLPVAPSARLEVALDQRSTWWVSFGWGAIATVWLGVLGVMWTLRSR